MCDMTVKYLRHSQHRTVSFELSHKSFRWRNWPWLLVIAQCSVTRRIARVWNIVQQKYRDEQSPTSHKLTSRVLDLFCSSLTSSSVFSLLILASRHDWRRSESLSLSLETNWLSHLFTGITSVHQVVLLDLHGLHLLLDRLHLQSSSCFLLLRGQKYNQGQNQIEEYYFDRWQKVSLQEKALKHDFWHCNIFLPSLLELRMDMLFCC